MKENFYHGMLLGLLAFKGSWTVSSNKEAGEGYADMQGLASCKLLNALTNQEQVLGTNRSSQTLIHPAGLNHI